MSSVIKMQNAFHGTTAAVRPRNGVVSARAAHAAWRKLCPFDQCQCDHNRTDDGRPTWHVFRALQDGSYEVCTPEVQS